MSRKARVQTLERKAGGGQGQGWQAGVLIQQADGLLRLPDGRVMSRDTLERLYPDLGFIILPEVEGADNVADFEA